MNAKIELLSRRGFSLGEIDLNVAQANDSIENWRKGMPVLLPKVCLEQLANSAQTMHDSEHLVLKVLDGEGLADAFDTAPYQNRLKPKFQSLGSAFNEGDDQEIEMVVFDALNNNRIIAEDIWLKCSWLSFYEDDASLRFRFSFGVDFEEDVALDPFRQDLASELSLAVFPESAIITENPALLDLIKTISGLSDLHFVERIIYFNAPHGGAYMHHDLERGHAGVVYAQLSGRTFWLALPKDILVQEVVNFVNTHHQTLENGDELFTLCQDTGLLTQELESFSNDNLINLINQTEGFVQGLVLSGHGRVLTPGDVIVLPQGESNCCWHSVFCLGDEMGQALSFAIR